MTSGEAISSEIIHINTIVILARYFVELNSRGLQMAYQRSIEIQVRVKTETLTEMLYLHNKFMLVVFV